jgi:nucleoside-diphosphate-sugar epimerase
MSKRVLLIGGTRFFGILLVRRLIEAGHDVTVATRGRAPDPFGGEVRRITVDRRVRSSMQRAFPRTGDYDLVYDQMCYNPLDAAISAEVFTGRVGRYVMASTIEVYDACRGQILRPLTEADVDLDREPIERDYPWHSESVPEERYGTGKRQAEVYFHRYTELPVVAVRIAHVLAGPADFTRRLASYVDAVREGRACRYSQPGGKSSFISAPGIARFMQWVGESEVLGPVNAASDGPLDARDLYTRVAQLLGRPPRIEPVSERLLPSELSPFDYPDPYMMSTNRARSLGYRFDNTGDWLDGVIREHIPAGVS